MASGIDDLLQQWSGNPKVLEILQLVARAEKLGAAVEGFAVQAEKAQKLMGCLVGVEAMVDDHRAFLARYHQLVQEAGYDPEAAIGGMETLVQDLGAKVASEGYWDGTHEKDQVLKNLMEKERWKVLEPIWNVAVERYRELPWMADAPKVKSAFTALDEAWKACRKHAVEHEYAKANQHFAKVFLKAKAKFVRLRDAHDDKARKAGAKVAKKKGIPDPFVLADTLLKALDDAEHLSLPEVGVFRERLKAELDSARSMKASAIAEASAKLVTLQIDIENAEKIARNTWKGLDGRYAQVRERCEAWYAVTDLGVSSQLSTLQSAWSTARGNREASRASDAVHALEQALDGEPFASTLAAWADWTTTWKARAEQAVGWYARVAAYQDIPDAAVPRLQNVAFEGKGFKDVRRDLLRASSLDGMTYAEAIDAVKTASRARETFREAKEAWVALDTVRTDASRAFEERRKEVAKAVEEAGKAVRAKAGDRADALLALWPVPQRLKEVQYGFSDDLWGATAVGDVEKARDTGLQGLADLEKALRDGPSPDATVEGLEDLAAWKAQVARAVQLLLRAGRPHIDLKAAIERAYGRALAGEGDDFDLAAHIREMEGVLAKSQAVNAGLLRISTQDAAWALHDSVAEYTAALDGLERRAEEVRKEVERLTVEPDYQVSREDQDRAAELRGELETAIGKALQAFAGLAKLAEKKLAMLPGSRARRQALKEWIGSRSDELALLQAQITATDDVKRLEAWVDRVASLQDEANGGEARITSLSRPPTTTLGERIGRREQALRADNVIGRWRAGGRDTILGELANIRKRIGEKPEYVLVAQYEEQKKAHVELDREARADAAAKVDLDEERAAWKLTVAAPAYVKLAETYPNVAAGHQKRLGDVKKKAKKAPQEALKALKALHTEVRDLLDGDKSGKLGQLETEARASAELDERLAARFRGMLETNEERYAGYRRTFKGHDALSAVKGLLKQAKQAGKAKSWEAGIGILGQVHERLEYVLKYPEGPAKVALDELPGVLTRWQGAAERYAEGVRGLLDAAAEASPAMKSALGDEVDALVAGIPAYAFDTSVRRVVAATDRKERLAEREKALAIVRDVQTFLFDDVRIRMLRRPPFQGVSVPLEPLARTLGDLERLLLMAVPLA
ncbi:MAG: hypothetical protein H6736_21515 [Alphaproteobacteria bacterium]|nr:hypothetical protein [Alphaproteobacteria bacterium]MCB9694397.1 hypothetical protein [Alphaproteobacteria bacterium]